MIPATMTQTVTSISLKPPATRKSSNKDVLLRLRPIVLGLQDNNYETLCKNLEEMNDFLQVNSISRSEKDIVKIQVDLRANCSNKCTHRNWAQRQ